MRADDGREVFLSAEGATGFHLDDAALVFGEAENERECVDEIERALHGAHARTHSRRCPARRGSTPR